MSTATVLEMPETPYCRRKEAVSVSELPFQRFILMKNSQVPHAATEDGCQVQL